MRYRRLGASGPTVSIVGLGCYTFGRTVDLSRARAIVGTALDAGITFFDTADIYGASTSEEILGAALGRRRDQVILATKFGQTYDLGYGPAAGSKGGRSYIRRAVEHSLRRLRTDYIDLYQMHVPDPAVPMAETLSTLNDLVREGKIRAIGSSNFAGWQIAEADYVATATGTVPFISAQNHWSILERGIETDVVPAALRFGVGLLPYFPLANGLLTGKVRRGTKIEPDTRLASHPNWLTDTRVRTVEHLSSWAASQGRTLLEVAISALAARPGCTSVITGATSPDQIAANAATTHWMPTPEDLADLDAIAPPPANLTADARDQGREPPGP